MSDVHDYRLDRLEADVREIKTIVPLVIRIDQRLTSELPNLATKADLAEKPSRLYMWAVVGALVAAQATILAAASLLSKIL